MNASEFVNQKLGDKNYTHSEFPISRATLIEWLNEYAEQQLKILNMPVVIKSVCVHPYEKVYQSDTECYCEICGHDFTEQTVL